MSGTFLTPETENAMSSKQRITGFFLAIPMLTLAVFGFFVFTVFLKATFLQWLMFNICAPSELVFFFLFIFSRKEPRRLFIVVPLLICFGTMGLFVFPWSGQGAFATQLSHILMTVSAVYVITINRGRSIPASITYWMLAVIIIIAVQQWYCRVNAETLKAMLNI